jgi:hypothetical protein
MFVEKWSQCHSPMKVWGEIFLFGTFRVAVLSTAL